MSTWKDVMPDYEIVCWDTNMFDINSNVFVSEAFAAKKWAFAADYIRIHALLNHGGIYLDTDVVVKKRFDEFLQYDFFTSMEYHYLEAQGQNATDRLNEDGSSKTPNTPIPGIGLQGAILGGIKGHKFLGDCLNWYQNKHFILDDGSFHDKVILPSILAMIAEKYGFLYIDKLQQLTENMLILPSEIFAGDDDQATSNAYAIHRCFGSWRDRRKKNRLDTLISRLNRYLFHHPQRRS